MSRFFKAPARPGIAAAALAVAAMMALMAAGFASSAPAHAQEEDNDYVDVALVLETPYLDFPAHRDLKVIVMNLGSRTAYDVEVVVNIVYPEDLSLFRFPPDVPIGAASLENGGYSFRWTIPELLGLQRVEVIGGVTHRRSAEPAFDAREYPHEFYGEVTSASFESDHRKGNNTDRVWSVLTSAIDEVTEPAQPDYSVNVSVDEQDPSPGDIVNFTVTTSHSTIGWTVIDQEVAIELTGGLTVDEDANADPPRTISYTPDDRAASVSYSNGVFNIGTLKFSEFKRNHSVTLPVRVANSAVVNEQCLTATITGNPPPEAGPRDDDISDNVAKLCLGFQALPYFTSDDVQEFVSHPCVDNSDPPCDNTDDVRVRAINAASGLALDAGTPLIHVPDDSTTRTYDGDTKSVNSEDKASWQTTVQIGYEPYASEHERWGMITHNLAYDMIGKDGALDKLHVRPAWGANDIFLNDGNRNADLFSFAPAAPGSNGPFDMTAEFEKLGTYKMDYTVTTTHDNNTDMDTTDDVEYSATGSYIFHVGPMADLAVEDSGASPHATADQHALTIVAVNNGPYIPLSAQVTGLPTGAQVIHISHGAYVGAAGEWKIGELRFPDYYRSAGTSEPTLVLSASAGDTASVSIANSENYEVCVGPKDNPGNLAHTTQAACEAVTNASWNSVPVYDYKPGNNTATIAAQAGTGGIGEGIPTLQTPSVNAPAVGLEWGEVQFLYGLPVKHYEIQRSTDGVSGWTQLRADFPLTDLVDIVIPSGQTRFYRVRAVNEAGVTGPWSQAVIARTGAASVPGAPIGVSATPDGDTAIDVSWSAPLDDGGAPITRYDLQWSANGTSGWRTAGSTRDGETLEFKNTGMTFGTTRYYRVAARNNRGLGVWSAPPHAMATTLSGVPGQPRLTARAADAYTIALTWNTPADNGDSITGYEIEWSVDGSVNSWSSLATPGPSDTSYDNAGLDPGARRYYRIRAVNGTGDGSWSRTVNAVTPPAVPGIPTPYAEANGENAIDLTWDPPADDGGADISGYEIHVSTNGGASYSRLTSLSASARAYTHSGLRPGDGRHYKLRARNRAGWGEFSDPVSAFTLTGAPRAPGLTARANGSTEIKLTWTEPDDRGAEIQSYDLEESDDGAAWNTLSHNIPSDDREYLHDGLSGGTTKYYRIRAANLNGEGQWSPTRSARTDAGGPEAPVLTLTAAGDNQIDLSWTVPADNGASIRGYWVERSVDGDAPWERLTSSHRTNSYSDDSLYRGMKRYYRVAATNSAGAGPFSNAASESTTGDPATGPAPPAFFRLSDVNRNQVTITWDPPDDDGGAPVSGYEYEVGLPCPDDPAVNCGLTGEDIRTTRGTSATITGLNIDGDYFFRARAVNPVGKGRWATDIQTTLRPTKSGSVRVSPTTITVDEGDTVTYTVRLSTAPPHPASVLIQPESVDGADDLADAVFAFNERVLIPSDWTHPGGDDWSDFTYNWSRGVRVSFTAPEDSDNVDDIAAVAHYVIAVPYDYYRPCEGAADPVQCGEDWDDAWSNSAYQSLTGAHVKVTVRDND